jgi:hypothetical protein
MIVTTVDDLDRIGQIIVENAAVTYEKIRKEIDHKAPLDFFTDLKFNKVGVDPLCGTELNFIEQLNQMFSNLVVISAARKLLELYPGEQFELCFGAMAGFDIASTDGKIVAECFAVTTAASNRKLEKDSKKLIARAVGKKKHIFFYSQNDSQEVLQRVYAKYSEIEYMRLPPLP